MITIIGLDPGFASVGYAALHVRADGTAYVGPFGVFETKKSDAKRNVSATDDNLRRAREIAAWLRETHDATPNVIAFAAESMSFPRSSSVAAKVAMCWGVIAAEAERTGRAILQASPQGVKRALCGAASASKDDVQERVAALYPEVAERRGRIKRSAWEHPHDALAVAHVMRGDSLVRMALAARGAACSVCW